MPDLQRLETPADLDRILARAKTGAWTELGLVGNRVRRQEVFRSGLIEEGWSEDRIFIFSFNLDPVPDSLLHLSNLTTLNLMCCSIGNDGPQALAAAEHFDKLKTLDLTRNRDIGLPQELIDSRDAQAIFRHLRAKGKQPLLAARIVVLGEGAKREKIDLRLWDFGGQRHLHASHRFFISRERNLYILVLNADKSRDDNHLEYWLELIRREARHAPVIVLITKCDKPGCDEPTRPLGSIDVKELKPRFPGVTAVIDHYGWSKDLEREEVPDREQTAARERHWDAHEALCKAIIDAIPHIAGVSVPYPAGFFKTMEWLETTLSVRDDAFKYITRDDYRKACCDRGLSKDQADDYLPVFRNLGLCHWVGDRRDVRGRLELEDLLFNPAWVKGPIYRLIRANTHDRGVMTEGQVQAALPAHDGPADPPK